MINLSHCVKDGRKEESWVGFTGEEQEKEVIQLSEEDMILHEKIFQHATTSLSSISTQKI